MLNELLATNAWPGALVAVVQSSVGHMHAAIFAARERDTILLADTNDVLEMSTIEMKAHARRSSGSAQTVRDWALCVHVVPWISSWNISAEEGWRGVGDRRWEDGHTDSMLCSTMSREGGKPEHISTFGASHLVLQALLVAVVFTSQSALVSSIGQMSSFNCRQANH